MAQDFESPGSVTVWRLNKSGKCYSSTPWGGVDWFGLARVDEGQQTCVARAGRVEVATVEHEQLRCWLDQTSLLYQ